MLSYGQALVTDDMIVWPARDGLYFLDPRDGRPNRRGAYRGPLNELFFGHVVYADKNPRRRHAQRNLVLSRAVRQDQIAAGLAAARTL